MPDHELNFPSEEEYMKENAYITALKNQQYEQEWFEEQQKITIMKKVKKPGKIRVEMHKFISERDEYFRQSPSNIYSNDLLIINGKEYYIN